MAARDAYLTRRLRPFTTTIFATMSDLAAATGSVNLGQGFPDTDGPDELREVAVGAIRAGRNLPYSCRGGMCCTCRAMLTHGRVEMDQNYSLEPWELQAGYVLTCQSHPVTDRVVVDYDQV